MLASALVAFAHHLLFFAVITALVIELVRVRVDMPLHELKRVQIVDAVYGAAAVLLIVVGVLRVMYFDKGADYYLDNVFFWAKMGLFIAVGLLSIYPTTRFAAWNKRATSDPHATPPADEIKRTRLIIHTELTGIALIMLCAALMAKGVG